MLLNVPNKKCNEYPPVGVEVILEDNKTDMTKFIVAFRGAKASKKASCWIWGRSVAQLVGALRYKPEGHWFYSGWCHSH